MERTLSVLTTLDSYDKIIEYWKQFLKDYSDLDETATKLLIKATTKKICDYHDLDYFPMRLWIDLLRQENAQVCEALKLKQPSQSESF